jgi:hypothetical protein
MIWLIPAGIAGVVFLLFILFFRDKDSVVETDEAGASAAVQI